MEKIKYFQRLPDQEYIFKNFFTCGKNEGLCCSDCGTYITNVVQVVGKADGQTYNLGTTCCDKISKDRSVFLTPLSVQRKKIFMNAFKKFQKIIKELESYAEENGGSKIKFAEVEIDYTGELMVTLFIHCNNGALIYNHLDSAQRCLSGLGELTKDYEFVFDVDDLFERKWNSETISFVRRIWNENFKKNNPDMWAEKKSNWKSYLDDKGVEVKYFKETETFEEMLKWQKTYKTYPQRF